jgi:asparagine synthase (glutamine-hydrolysing)
MGDASEADVVEHYTSILAKANSQAGTDIVAQLMQLNLITYLPEDLLVKVDRTSMAVSLEARAPFLDHVLLQFAARIPTSLKLKGSTSKYIFKKAMRGILPDEIIDRKKHGFGVPVGAWMRGDLAGFVEETLCGPRAKKRGIFDAEGVREMLTTHTRGKVDLGQGLWTLLTFELWMQRYFD